MKYQEYYNESKWRDYVLSIEENDNEEDIDWEGEDTDEEFRLGLQYWGERRSVI
jgi:hypothetical protein